MLHVVFYKQTAARESLLERPICGSFLKSAVAGQIGSQNFPRQDSTDVLSILTEILG
ncbi:hypothetical protein RSK20926_13874 [Roseobacter sp. SK209-2-6]|nr:hypothetical protein RSK20926_13874 [Roseobacter sp. SK209-2-6]